jgi:hypothetical protein
MMYAIEPADVYAQVLQLRWVVFILFAAVMLQIVAKVVIFGRVIDLLRKAERLLTLAEKHGAVTDDRTDRVAKSARATAEEIKMSVSAVPEKTAEKVVAKIREQAAGDSEHDLKFRVPDSGPHPKPPERPTSPLLAWIVPAMILTAGAACAAAVMTTSREATMTAPVNPTAARQYDRAVTEQRAMKFGEALAAYRAAAAAGYDPCLALFGVAECAFYLKDDAAVRAACGDLLKCPGGAGRARFWLAHVLRREGKEDLARQEWEQSFKEGFALAGMILAGSPHRQGGANNG